MDDLLRPILNIDILDMFQQRVDVEEVPLNFEAGHYDYYRIWEQLFLLETYSLLIQKARGAGKEADQGAALRM